MRFTADHLREHASARPGVRSGSFISGSPQSLEWDLSGIRGEGLECDADVDDSRLYPV